ncbi:TetR family transcriptional regulator [Streptomyces cinnamoneus]|uniref:TetR family transcriptional regulator n=1 Tax=Streptomyces cinnamoneus TaxID=53446 RepID=A0A2G1XE97_STRCJ|nr:TetR family transcriptional regulator [Streptomyces cinnamoneus]PHQ49557.1 TetR family transcriptional regulator [Streptomyces cinnamoneus]PPT14723.1 TetR family transcriptional regulator [Streptomyces cinnamoneus]
MLTMASAQTSPTAQPGSRLGLRERKKIQTRQAIRRAAYRLFAEHGYDSTSVDRIAEAADVSPSTVFRYFPTKEDIVLTDEYDPVLEAAIRARPAQESPVEAIRQGVLDSMRQIIEHDLVELRERTRLVRDVPALRGRSAEGMGESARMLCKVLAERTGRDADDLELRIVITAVLASMQEAMMYWVEQGQTEDVVALIDRTLDVLGRGLTL